MRRGALLAGLVGVVAALAAVRGRAQDAALAPRPAAPTLDDARVTLGRTLFFDARLSGDATVHCATCHDPAQGFSDGRAVARGYPGAEYFRNTPSLLDIAHRRTWYWDGRLADTDCETVIRDHLAAPYLMNLNLVLCTERLRQVPAYVTAFATVFGRPPTADDAITAVAEFCRSLRTGPAPLDRHLEGDAGALSEAARRGLAVFTGAGGCSACHGGPTLADGQSHAVPGPTPPSLWDVPERRVTLRRFLRGLDVPDYAAEAGDPGRFAVTHAASDRGRFRTPSLRNVAHTAPYMHDGRFATLEAVLDACGTGAHPHAPSTRPPSLDPRARADLLAFLHSLTGAVPPVPPVAPPPYAVR